MRWGAQWLTSAKEPDELIYQITKALWNDKTRKLLDVGHAKGKVITLTGIGFRLGYVVVQTANDFGVFFAQIWPLSYFAVEQWALFFSLVLIAISCVLMAPVLVLQLRERSAAASWASDCPTLPEQTLLRNGTAPARPGPTKSACRPEHGVHIAMSK